MKGVLEWLGEGLEHRRRRCSTAAAMLREWIRRALEEAAGALSTLRQQSTTLRQQSTTLRQQSTTLRQQSTTLRQQSTTLRQQSTTLRQQSTTLSRYQCHRSRHTQRSARTCGFSLSLPPALRLASFLAATGMK